METLSTRRLRQTVKRKSYLNQAKKEEGPMAQFQMVTLKMEN